MEIVFLNANGGVLYIWSGGVSNNFSFVPDSTMMYSVNVTDGNGCQNTDSVLVQVNQILVCLLVQIHLSACLIPLF